MLRDLTQPLTDDGMLDHLEEVKSLMADALGSTSLGFVVNENTSLIASGKMLRSRMAFRVGPKNGVSNNTLVHASAAIELIHTASLLHDDVIDGGLVRRGAPTFWVERGIPGAILLGDLMLFKALDLICKVENGRLTHQLIRCTGELCEAEAEQDILLQGTPSELEACVRIARRKTGALFGFIGYACSGEDETLQQTLTEAGYAIGTAYQMSDDLLDAYGDPDDAGKTLGTDLDRGIISAAALAANPTDFIRGLCTKAETSLEPWAPSLEGIQEYLDLDIYPALDKLQLSTSSLSV
jgi:geranylgeranyl pyrophosphate synthase